MKSVSYYFMAGLLFIPFAAFTADRTLPPITARDDAKSRSSAAPLKRDDIHLFKGDKIIGIDHFAIEFAPDEMSSATKIVETYKSWIDKYDQRYEFYKAFQENARDEKMVSSYFYTDLLGLKSLRRSKAEIVEWINEHLPEYVDEIEKKFPDVPSLQITRLSGKKLTFDELEKNQSAQAKLTADRDDALVNGSDTWLIQRNEKFNKLDYLYDEAAKKSKEKKEEYEAKLEKIKSLNEYAGECKRFGRSLVPQLTSIGHDWGAVERQLYRASNAEKPVNAFNKNQLLPGIRKTPKAPSGSRTGASPRRRNIKPASSDSDWSSRRTSNEP